MRKLILKMEVTVDGFVGQLGRDPAWPVAYYDDELAAHEADLLSRAGIHAMGRQAYEDMNPHWQASSGPIADAMNAIPKAVFSSTIEDASWAETTVYRGDIGTEIAALKAQDGGPILAHGGARFAQGLTGRKLVDEYWLNAHPVAFGDGLPLFGGPVDLKLVSAKTFATGTVALTYTT